MDQERAVAVAIPAMDNTVYGTVGVTAANDR